MPTISIKDKQENQETKPVAGSEFIKSVETVEASHGMPEMPEETDDKTNTESHATETPDKIEDLSSKTETPDQTEDSSESRMASLEPVSEKDSDKKPEKENIEKKNVKRKKSFLERLNAIGTVSSRDVVEFTRHIAVMLGAGVTIFEAILFLKDQTRNKVFKDRLESIIESLNNGQALSNAMRKFPKIFPPIYTNIVQVGEKSGTLSQTMVDLADHLEDSEEFKRKVKGALIYPKIIVSVMLTFILILLLFVMPRILTIFNSLDAEIPLATRVMIGVTDFVNNHIILIIGGVFVLGAFIFILFKNPAVQKARDLFYIKVPLFGRIVANYNTAQVSQHFGTLFASGITIVKCLEITSTVIKNKIYIEEIEFMMEKIKKGSALSQSFPEKSYFPPMFIKLFKVGERTGKLPHVVEYMRKYYKGLVDNDVKNITTVIEPVIMVLLGLMVAGLVVTVIGPIYQLISNVGN